MTKRPSNFDKEYFAFEGMTKKLDVNAMIVDKNEFESLKLLFPTADLIDQLRRMYEYVKDSENRYLVFIKSITSGEKNINAIEMNKILNDYESVMVDYLLKSSVFINQVRTHNNKLIEAQYECNAFGFVQILRNLLEHNQIPLKRVTHVRTIGTKKQHNKKQLIASADKKILIDFVKKNKNKNENYKRNDINLINRIETNDFEDVIISKSIEKHQKIVNGIFISEIGKLVSSIPDEAIYVLGKYYWDITNNEFNLSGIVHGYMDKNNSIYPNYEERYIFNKETLVLINDPSKSKLIN